MFILDLYKFCEGSAGFNRQQLAKFIFSHRECERIARSAGVMPRWFASSCSKEFLARMCSLGYLDLKNGLASVTGAHNRPFNFEFNCFGGENDRYTVEMMNIGSMSDAELFK